MPMFITFEGCEGSGKSTQASILFQRMTREGYKAVLTHEPGGTSLGEEITRLLKWAKYDQICPLSELLLFNASRAELINSVIRPSLNRGQMVICDRYTDSTVAYQGFGRGLSLACVKTVNSLGSQGLNPNFTILLDMPVRTGQYRKRKQEADRFEQEKEVFHQKVRDGYLHLAKETPSRWLVIDADQSQEQIADTIWNHLKSYFDRFT